MSTQKRDTVIKQEDEELTAASALACLARDREPERVGEEPEQNQEEDDDDSFIVPQRFTKSGRKRAVPFVIKLLKVLSDKKNSHIITWMPSGKSFNILKPKAFVGVILPEHFKTAKYSSFTRKLHRWGFVRHYRGEEAGAFYHKDFQRDRLDLVEKMTCHKAEAPKSAAPVQKEAAEKLAAAKVVGRKQPSPTQVAKKPETPLVTAQAPAKPCESKTAMLSLSQQQRAQPALPVHTERFNAQQLNAAIEFEVARRLRERINSVALSRQAFAISTLRQQQLGPSTGQLAALLLKKQNGELSNNTPLNFSQRGYRALASNGQPSAPETNIQGARTA